MLPTCCCGEKRYEEMTAAGGSRRKARSRRLRDGGVVGSCARGRTRALWRAMGTKREKRKRDLTGRAMDCWVVCSLLGMLSDFTWAKLRLVC